MNIVIKTNDKKSKLKKQQAKVDAKLSQEQPPLPEPADSIQKPEICQEDAPQGESPFQSISVNEIIDICYNDINNICQTSPKDLPEPEDRREPTAHPPPKSAHSSIPGHLQDMYKANFSKNDEKLSQRPNIVITVKESKKKAKQRALQVKKNETNSDSTADEITGLQRQSDSAAPLQLDEQAIAQQNEETRELKRPNPRHFERRTESQ